MKLLPNFLPSLLYAGTTSALFKSLEIWVEAISSYMFEIFLHYLYNFCRDIVYRLCLFRFKVLVPSITSQISFKSEITSYVEVLSLAHSFYFLLDWYLNGLYIFLLRSKWGFDYKYKEQKILKTVLYKILGKFSVFLYLKRLFHRFQLM